MIRNLLKNVTFFAELCDDAQASACLLYESFSILNDIWMLDTGQNPDFIYSILFLLVV